MPIFDLDNAVQQGLNRDITNNDWNVEARNLEIVLEDNAGAGEFRVHDSDNVAVIVGASDGYFSVHGTAEVHGGNLLVEAPTSTNVQLLTLRDSADEVGIYIFDADPNGTISAQQASIGMNYNDGYLYTNLDGSTNWERFVLQTDINVGLDTITLQRAYDNDPDGGDATIVTNSTDGNVIIAGTEALQVTATGGIDLDTGFDMDGAGPFDVDITGAVSIDADAASNFTVDSANLTLETTTSGDVLVNVPAAGAGNLTVSDGTNQYLSTDTTNFELTLGDATGQVVDVRVLNDLVVDGDLTVDGTTTTVNTEELFVEDRLIRLNINAADSFNGTTGFEAEVGSDGYVEFHWDDSQSRWEISIDRSLTSEGETFRPLPYLADSPGTLDLSSIGTGGYPTSGPNPDAGASVINTNATNFPYTFGPDMLDNSVQAALEAIDGYFQELDGKINGVTLQQAYDNDDDGADATITTDSIDGNVVIAGDQAFQVTATGGIDLDSDFDQDGATFNSNLTGAFSVTAGAASDITTSSGTLTLDGATGVLLDGNGSNVIPATDNTDSLGSATNGWTDIYLNNALHGGAIIALSAAGSTSTHNSTAGADLVGTNADNFLDSFGGDMIDNTVQSALEAIDGYFQFLTVGISSAVTLQSAYDNDPNGGDATITTNATDGAVVIAGTEKLQVTATGGFDLDTGFDMDGSGPFDVDITGAVSIDADGYSNFLVQDAGLVVGTVGDTGTLNLLGQSGIVLDGTGDNVIPGDSCTDSLGDATHGWTTIWLCNGNNVPVSIGSAGSASTPNDLSGAFVVGTDADNFATFGGDMTSDTVQAALEAIDGYFQNLNVSDLVDSTFTQERGLELQGAILNGNAKVSTVGSMAALEYKDGKLSRASWTIPVPADWDGLSDITVEVVWSPSSTNTGDVEWRLEYLARTSTELASAAFTTVDSTQAANGTTDAIQTVSLAISAGDIDVTDEVIAINVVRRGSAVGDTFTDDARVHLVKYGYTAENIVA